MRRGRLLGLSKMFVKSMIFAIAGILATLVFRLINKRKAEQLHQMEEEERRQERELLQQEWDLLEARKQPLLQITPLSQPSVPRPTQVSYALPWSEEESKTSRGGYDG